mgnify:CR=1 FL=1
MVSERVGKKVHIILSNNFSYEGTVIDEDNFFIIILDRFNKKVTIGKRDIQVIKEVQNGSQ